MMQKSRVQKYRDKFVIGFGVGMLFCIVALQAAMNLAHDPGAHPIQSAVLDIVSALFILSDTAAIVTSAILLILHRKEQSKSNLSNEMPVEKVTGIFAFSIGIPSGPILVGLCALIVVCFHG